jgi:hypothetical protein
LILDDDLKFISGGLEDYEMPDDKKYLLKYFDTPLQITFVKYLLIFGNDYSNFVNHTGMKSRKHWLKKLYDRYIALETAKRKARQNIDFETLSEIETGKFKFG